LLLFFVPQLHAESYRGIGPLDNLGDVKTRFPNAKVEKLSPGWAQSTDALYEFTGVGLSGSIIVKFDDYRPNWKEMAEKDPTSKNAEFYQNLSNQSDEEAMSVSWVRWVPSTRIPLKRLILKYGKPEHSGFSDVDYQPYRSWDKKGVTASLSDDEKYVDQIDFDFTREEYRKAYLEKYKFVPDWLKDKKSPAKKK
jgi:hypothetical protein